MASAHRRDVESDTNPLPEVPAPNAEHVSMPTAGRSAWDRLRRVLSVAALAVSALLLGLMMLTICSSVTARYAFGRPLTWTDDLTTAFFIGVIFLPLAAVARENGHVAVDFVLDALRRPTRQRLATLGALVGIAYVATLLVAAIMSSHSAALSGDTTFGLLPVPLLWLYAVISVGALLLLFEIVTQLFRSRTQV